MSDGAKSTIDYNLLLVDNDAAYIESCREYLESAGFHVYTANSVAEARKKLDTLWLHLAVVDVRLTNDDDDKDKTGLELARSIAPVLPTLILTRYTNVEDVRKAMKPQAAGQRAVVDYIDKRKPLSELLQAIQELIGQNVDFNIKLKIDWKAFDRYSLISFIEPDLSLDLIPNRFAELEDLFRKLFKQDSIRIHSKLWHEPGRVAVVVFAFESRSLPEPSVVVCGLRKIVDEEAGRFKKYAPKTLQDTGTALQERVHTIHYSALAYTLNNNDFEGTHPLTSLYQAGPEKSFYTAVEALFGNLLQAWHQNKRVHVQSRDPSCVHSSLLEAVLRENFEARARAIEDQITTLGFRLTRSKGELNVRVGSRTYRYADPLPAVARLAAQYPLELAVKSPGNLSGESVLTDGRGRVWLTDFGCAGLAPSGWNAANLEAAIRFDWLDLADLTQRFDLEKALVQGDFTNPDSRDLEPACKKAAHASAAIRKLYSDDPQNDLGVYHWLVFLQAAQRLLNYDPAMPLIGPEIARMGQIWLAMGMLAALLEKPDAGTAVPVPDEIRIKDVRARLLEVAGREVSLPARPFSLLQYLYENAGHVCTRTELLDKVLQGKYNEDYLDSLVGRIRKALGDDAKRPRYLTTIPNTGYCLKRKP